MSTPDFKSKRKYLLNSFFLFNFFSFRAAVRRKSKDKKFGFGGKKKGLKSNTRSSANDISDYKPGKKGRGAGKGNSNSSGGAKGGRGQNMGTKLKAKRMGKNRRKNVAGRKK